MGAVLKRLDLGFGVAIAGQVGAPQEDHDRGDFDFEEKVRVEEDDLRIEIDVRIRRGRGGEHRHRHPPRLPSPAPGPANYEKWLRGQVTLFGDCLAALGGTDPFGIAGAIAQIEAAGAGDLVALTTAHASVLDRFDPMMTMLQKATGDRADILQMASWHRDLCVRSARLVALPGTAAMQHHLQHFIDRVERRIAVLDDYGALLTGLVPGLHQAAAGLGAAGRLGPLIGALSTAGSARAKEKAHRDMLLVLQQVA